MIKNTLLVHVNVNIQDYKKLTCYLRRQNDTYSAKKSKVFTMEQVKQFVRDASDNEYLLIKVALLFGLHGACRVGELRNIMVEHISDAGNIAVITLHDTKTKKYRTFTITGDCNSYQLYKKYFDLRPKDVSHDFF